MTEVSDRYGRVADGFTRRLEGVAADGWSSPTPCSDWTVRDLVAHVITTQRRVMANVDRTEPVDVMPEAELAPQWRQAMNAIVAALDDEARASTLVSGMFGDQPFEVLVGRLLCTDTLVHTWDLARATGQDEMLDPDAVAQASASLSPMDDAIRRPGGFGPKIAPPSGSDAQTQFLNFCGRGP